MRFCMTYKLRFKKTKSLIVLFIFALTRHLVFCLLAALNSWQFPGHCHLIITIKTIHLHTDLLWVISTWTVTVNYVFSFPGIKVSSLYLKTGNAFRSIARDSNVILRYTKSDSSLYKQSFFEYFLCIVLENIAWKTCVKS